MSEYEGYKNTLNQIEKFIKSENNPTLQDYKEISQRLLNDNCQSLAGHIITYIEEIGQELQDLREELNL